MVISSVSFLDAMGVCASCASDSADSNTLKYRADAVGVPLRGRDAPLDPIAEIERREQMKHPKMKLVVEVYGEKHHDYEVDTTRRSSWKF